MRRLISDGPGTRPALAASLKLSKPTLTAAMQELVELGLVEERGQEDGGPGRRPMIYGLGRKAGFVMGVDLGSTQIGLIAETLDGETVAEVNEDLQSPSIDDPAAATLRAATVVRKLRPALTARHGPLRAIAIGVPVIVSETHSQLSRNAWLAALRENFSFGDVRPIIENNVNCAAIAELRRGAARGRQAFAYLQVGVKIGLGLVHNGTLYRGANGAAGEVSRIPYPWAEGMNSVRGGLEKTLGSAALLRQARESWPDDAGASPATVRELFAAASAGVEAARRCVDRYGAEIGRLAAAVIGITDPGLIVMGGGVGQNPLLVPKVREVCEALAWPTEIVSSGLGGRGTVLGAVQLAAGAAMDALLGSNAS